MLGSVGRLVDGLVSDLGGLAGNVGLTGSVSGLGLVSGPVGLLNLVSGLGLIGSRRCRGLLDGVGRLGSLGLHGLVDGYHLADLVFRRGPISPGTRSAGLRSRRLVRLVSIDSLVAHVSLVLSPA